MALVPPLGGTLEMVDTPLGPMAVETLGSGPTFVLLHAPWPGSCRDEWRELAQRLVATGYRVVAPDLPGFGDSPAQPQRYTAAGMIDALGGWLATLPRAVVVARAMSVAYVAACRPDAQHVRLLIAISPMGAEAPVLADLRYEECLGPEHEFSVRGIKDYLCELYDRYEEMPATRTAKGMKGLLETLAQRPHEQHVKGSSWAGLLKYDARADWCALAQPILLLWGQRGAEPKLAEAERWLRLVRPNAPAIDPADQPAEAPEQTVLCMTIRGTRDWPHVEAADDVANTIIDWVRASGRADYTYT